MSNTTPSPATFAKQLKAKAARKLEEEPRTFGWTGPLRAIIEFEPPAWIYDDHDKETDQGSPAEFNQEFYFDLEAELVNSQDELADDATGTEDDLDLEALDDSIDDMAEFEAEFGDDGSWLPTARDLGFSWTPRLKRTTNIDPMDPMEALDADTEYHGIHLVA
jgi:hypothetical protein